ncbi:unnamed protein product [Prunus armeniaca]|nr:hypothetical protein GBA52_020535 [Prunus armeniaca]
MEKMSYPLKGIDASELTFKMVGLGYGMGELDGSLPLHKNNAKRLMALEAKFQEKIS